MTGPFSCAIRVIGVYGISYTWEKYGYRMGTETFQIGTGRLDDVID
jgi:hypothetical protein